MESSNFFLGLVIESFREGTKEEKSKCLQQVKLAAEVSEKFQSLENTSKHNQFHGTEIQTVFKIHWKNEEQLQIVLNDPLEEF